MQKKNTQLPLECSLLDDVNRSRIDLDIANHSLSFESFQELSESNLQRELKEEFENRKSFSVYLALMYDYLHSLNQKDNRFSKPKIDRVLSCADFLGFQLTNNGYKLKKANFCRDRLCPMCQRRKSLKMFGQVSQIMDLLCNKEQFGSLRFGFLTLTVKNCSDEDLKDNIDLLIKGKHDFIKYLSKKNIIVGAFSSLELKIGLNGLWHPHLHLILAFPVNYFRRNYLTQKEWSELWKKFIKVDYDPVIDIRMIRNYEKGKNETVTDKDLKKAVAECSKYSLKSDSYLYDSDIDLSAHRILTILDSCYHRRFYSFYGVFSDARNILNLDDIEDGNLINTDTVEINQVLSDEIKYARWNGFGYVLA